VENPDTRNEIAGRRPLIKVNAQKSYVTNVAKRATSHVIAPSTLERRNPLVKRNLTLVREKSPLRNRLNAMSVERKATFHPDVRNANRQSPPETLVVRAVGTRVRDPLVGRRVREKAAEGGKALSFRT